MRMSLEEAGDEVQRISLKGAGDEVEKDGVTVYIKGIQY